MRTIITGGAGFVGSHLCERFVSEKHEVICVDNFIAGNEIVHTNHFVLLGYESLTEMGADKTRTARNDGSHSMSFVKSARRHLSRSEERRVGKEARYLRSRR